VHPHVLSQTFERVQLKAGLPRIRLPDLRHTHATLLYLGEVAPMQHSTSVANVMVQENW
jgi:integrase